MYKRRAVDARAGVAARRRVDPSASMGCFDEGVRVLAVDWSGAVHRPEDRIRVAEARVTSGHGSVGRGPGAHGPRGSGSGADGSGGVGGAELVDVDGGRDREAVVEHVLRIAATGPVVVGLDFSFAFPAWFARSHGCVDVTDVWALAGRAGESWLRSCPPPFWGRPGTRRPPPDPERPLWRRTELAAWADGLRPLSTFQVGGAGAVGTGSVRGMPLLTRLRGGGVAVWPFDDAGPATVLEVYPRAMTGPVVKSSEAARRAVAIADPGIPAELVDAVVATEDAFDAALTALGLARHLTALRSLPAAASDSDEAIEGAIWRP